MSYSIDQDEGILGIINKIAAEPINESQYTAVRNPKPIVEAITVFDDAKVDFSKWTTDAKKVNKAKTAPSGHAKQVTENDTVDEKKKDGKVTEVVSETADHEAKDEPKPKTGSFDTAAKNAASSNRSSADAKKKFEENCKKQRNNAKEFKNFVESLVVDAESREVADKIIAEFESEFEESMKQQQAQFEGVGIFNSIRMTPDEMKLMLEMRDYHKELCQQGELFDTGHHNPLGAEDNRAILDDLVEVYNSVEDLPPGFVELYHKLGGKKI